MTRIRDPEMDGGVDEIDYPSGEGGSQVVQGDVAHLLPSALDEAVGIGQLVAVLEADSHLFGVGKDGAPVAETDGSWNPIPYQPE